MSHLKLGIHAFNQGVQHIPDSALENIPYFGPKYFKEDKKEKERRDREKSRQSGYSSDSSNMNLDESEAERGEKRSRRQGRRQSKTRDRRGRDRDRGYESDRGPRGYDGSPYFPPPPTQPIDNQQENQQAYIPRRYDAQEYGERPGTRDQYYAGHPLEQRPFIPPPPGSQQQPGGPQYDATDRRSSIADRYRPSNYVPSNYVPSPGHLSPGYQTASRERSPFPPNALAIRRHSQQEYHPADPYHGYGDNAYLPPHGRDDDEYYDSRRDRSGSRRRQDYDNPKGRSEDVSERVKEEFKRHKKDIGASAIGALAGSIIGNQFAKKDSKLGIFVGAAIGGIGGGLLERKHENDKRRRLERRQSSRIKSDRKDGYESY